MLKAHYILDDIFLCHLTGDINAVRILSRALDYDSGFEQFRTLRGWYYLMHIPDYEKVFLIKNFSNVSLFDFFDIDYAAAEFYLYSAKYASLNKKEAIDIASSIEQKKLEKVITWDKYGSNSFLDIGIPLVRYELHALLLVLRSFYKQKIKRIEGQPTGEPLGVPSGIGEPLGVPSGVVLIPSVPEFPSETGNNELNTIPFTEMSIPVFTEFAKYFAKLKIRDGSSWNSQIIGLSEYTGGLTPEINATYFIRFLLEKAPLSYSDRFLILKTMKDVLRLWDVVEGKRFGWDELKDVIINEGIISTIYSVFGGIEYDYLTATQLEQHWDEFYRTLKTVKQKLALFEDVDFLNEDVDLPYFWGAKSVLEKEEEDIVLPKSYSISQRVYSLFKKGNVLPENNLWVFLEELGVLQDSKKYYK